MPRRRSRAERSSQREAPLSLRIAATMATVSSTSLISVYMILHAILQWRAINAQRLPRRSPKGEGGLCLASYGSANIHRKSRAVTTWAAAPHSKFVNYKGTSSKPSHSSAQQPVPQREPCRNWTRRWQNYITWPQGRYSRTAQSRSAGDSAACAFRLPADSIFPRRGKRDLAQSRTCLPATPRSSADLRTSRLEVR